MILVVANSSRSSLCKGFLAQTSYDISPEMSQYQARQQTMSPALRLRIKWQDLCVQCASAVSENGIRNLTPDQDRALSIIIKSYEVQIRELELTAADGKYIFSPTHTITDINQTPIDSNVRLLSSISEVSTF